MVRQLRNIAAKKYLGLMEVKYFHLRWITQRDAPGIYEMRETAIIVKPEKFFGPGVRDHRGCFMLLTIGKYKFTIEMGRCDHYRTNMMIWKGHALTNIDDGIGDFDPILWNHNLPEALVHGVWKTHNKQHKNRRLGPVAGRQVQEIDIYAKTLGTIIRTFHQIFQPELDEVYLERLKKWTFLNCNHRMPNLQRPYLPSHIRRMIVDYLKS